MSIQAILKLILVFLCSCASIQSQNQERYDELSTRLEFWMGAEQTKVAQAFGPPTQETKVENLTFWKYRNSLGVHTSSRQATNVWTGESLGFGYSNSFERYDEYTITFKDGKMINWTAVCQ